MEDVQDLTEREMAPNLEEPGQDRGDEPPGETTQRRHHVSTSLSHRTRLFQILQGRRLQRARASVPPLPVTRSSEDPQPHHRPPLTAASVSPRRTGGPGGPSVGADKQARPLERSLCTRLPRGGLVTGAPGLPTTGERPVKHSSSSHTPCCLGYHSVYTCTNSGGEP